MIKDKNLDPDADHLIKTAVLHVTSVAASQADVEQATWVAPHRCKILGVDAYVVAITDADDSARLDVKEAGTSILSSTINPTQATKVSGTISDDDVASGAVVGLYATTGVGDLLTNVTVTIKYRPYAGTVERISKGLSA